MAAAKPALEAEAIQALALAPLSAALPRALAGDPHAGDGVAYLPAGCGLETLAIDGEPAAIIIDRAGRIVDIGVLDTPHNLIARWRATASYAANEPARGCTATAPVLLIPNVASRDFCARVIEHFEGSAHSAGVMASFADGAAFGKLDETKKRRRDMVLDPASPLHAEIVELMGAAARPR